VDRGTGPYVLLTAAYNEEACIEATIRSVDAQTVRPFRWVIVSDGSTDRTNEIVRRWAAASDYILFLPRQKDQHRGFASKVSALGAGLKLLNGDDSPFIGHIDGDVTLEPNYFESLLKKFSADPELGIGGGWIWERVNGEFQQRRGNSTTSVPGAVQMFRRKCHEDVGGLLPMEFGGEDSYAEVKARMCGWRVQAFPDLKVCHHHKMGKTALRLLYCYRQGFMDFALGNHPLFELARVIRRVPSKPYFVSAAARLLGFGVAHISGRRMVPEDFIAYLRREQLNRLRTCRRFRGMVL
jgi:glycosyltransferase involved in cell wall biosynthesis